jgi:uncharacterized protein
MKNDSPIIWPELLGGDNRKPVLILLLAPWLLTTFKYFGSAAFYHTHLVQRFVVFGDAAATAELYHFLAAFILLGVIPALAVRFVFREPLADWGVQWGDVRFSLKALLALAPVMVAATYLSAPGADFMAEYPFDKGAGRSAAHFARHAAAYGLYYAGWEFFFRGFLQFGLRQRMGEAPAILVQTLASCLVHIGKPAGEIYGAIVAGLVWGWIVFRARSLWAVLLTHWVLGVALDYFICFCGRGR